MLPLAVYNGENLRIRSASTTTTPSRDPALMLKRSRPCTVSCSRAIKTPAVRTIKMGPYILPTYTSIFSFGGNLKPQWTRAFPAHRKR
jgi:hypothetical protein